MTTMRSRSRKKPTRRNDPAGVRRKILDAAHAMFQDRGYNGTSMQDLMDATDTSGGALHHHFPTKKTLALAVFKERVAPAVRETWIDPVRSGRPFAAAIQSVFNEITQGVEARGAVRGCPLNNLALELSLVDRDFRTVAQGIFAEWQVALAEAARGSRGGASLTKSERMALASFIVSSYSGAMALAKTEQSSKSLRSVARILQEWLGEQGLAT
jgi:AcrR family transcriptional regulator